MLLAAGVLVAFTLTTPSAEAASSYVDVTTLNSAINSASLHMLTQAIDTAEHDGAQALVVEVDTPGGDSQSMNAMVRKELTSSVPIIAYVAPAGAQAASAGAFVTLAAHVTAMAPTTRIGASSPVTGSGGDVGRTLKAKIENDLVAAMTGIQARYGRNVALAKAMITDARSYDDTTAVQGHIVDLSAANLSELLQKVQGRTVKLDSGRIVTLQTADVAAHTLQTNGLDRFSLFLLDPNVIFLLFVVAMMGIYLEISHPGAILPGVAGAIALVLFLFAIGSLAPNWAGLLLMVVAFVLLVLDLRLPTHGVLSLGTVIALILGALLFFNGGDPYAGAQVSPLVVSIVSGVIGLIGLTLVTFGVRAGRRHVSNGVEGMIGANVVALTVLCPEGRVSYGGENWAAVLDAPTTFADVGTKLQIISVEGLRLRVRPLDAFWRSHKTSLPFLK
jgi:membrane-bound serine protease (ClpP class)